MYTSAQLTYTNYFNEVTKAQHNLCDLLEAKQHTRDKRPQDMSDEDDFAALCGLNTDDFKGVEDANADEVAQEPADDEIEMPTRPPGHSDPLGVKHGRGDSHVALPVHKSSGASSAQDPVGG